MANELEKRYPSFTFLLFSLNPMATVAFLEDEEAVAATKIIPNKQYLAMLTQASYSAHLDGGLHTTLELRVVSRKYPKSQPLPEMNENSFVPIFPASHPSGRRPVRPNAVLPWDNCFFHCRQGINFVPASVDRENAKFVAITEEDGDYLTEAIDADIDDREDKWRAAVQSEEPLYTPGQCSTESFGADFLTAYKQDIDNDGCDSEDGDRRESISLEEQLLLKRLEYTEFYVYKAIDISYNLSPLSEIGDLDDLLLQMEQISTIIDDSRDRAKSRLREIAKSKAQNLAWVKDANVALGIDDDVASIDKPVTADYGTSHESTGIVKGRGSPRWGFRKPRFMGSISKFKAPTFSLKISSLIFGCFGSSAVSSDKAIV